MLSLYFYVLVVCVCRFRAACNARTAGHHITRPRDGPSGKCLGELGVAARDLVCSGRPRFVSRNMYLVNCWFMALPKNLHSRAGLGLCLEACCWWYSATDYSQPTYVTWLCRIVVSYNVYIQKEICYVGWWLVLHNQQNLQPTT